MMSFAEMLGAEMLARAIRLAGRSAPTEFDVADASSYKAEIEAGSEADASWTFCAGFAVNAACSIGLTGLPGGAGIDATFSLRDPAAAASAGGFSADLRGAGTVVPGAAAASSAWPLAPNILASKPGMRLRWVVSEADWLLRCPFAKTLASCGSGMRGQWRTLPVSIC